MPTLFKRQVVVRGHEFKKPNEQDDHYQGDEQEDEYQGDHAAKAVALSVQLFPASRKPLLHRIHPLWGVGVGYRLRYRHGANCTGSIIIYLLGKIRESTREEGKRETRTAR